MHDPLVLAWSIRSPIPRRDRFREKHTDQPRWSIRRRRFTNPSDAGQPTEPWWRPRGYQVRLAGRCVRTRELIAIWHVEPGGRDALEVCGPVLSGRWRWHVRHWKVTVRPWQRLRKRFTRCDECGRRMGGDGGSGYMGGSAIYHMECMALSVEEAVEALQARTVGGGDRGTQLWREHYRLRKQLGWTFPRVTGTCPACGGHDTLFVAQGGHITCNRSDCPDPGAVADLLDRPDYHVLDVGPDGWALQHAITCFHDLLDCDTHRQVSVWMDTLEGPPAPVGRYRITEGEDAFSDPALQLVPLPPAENS